MPKPKPEPMVPFSAYQALVSELVSLKRDGLVRPDQLPPAPEIPLLPDIIQQAIASIAGPEDQALRDHLIGQAWNLKRQGLEDSDVAQRIADGEPAEL